MPSDTEKQPPNPSRRLRLAKDKAGVYRQIKDEPIAAEQSQQDDDPPQTLEEWRDVVGQRVEEAMRNGAFDNLRGHGKPLNLQRDPFIPEEQQMAYQIMKDNDLVPAWIDDRNEVLREIEQLRAEVRTTVEHVRAQWEASPRPETRMRLEQFWQNTIEHWTGQFRKLNSRITTVNLKQPLDFLEIIKPSLEHELHKSGARIQLDWLAE